MSYRIFLATASAAALSLSAATAQDIVHLNDVIIDGSACIGFDCVNGESFGFDTLRLKENNLRIKFDDTSTAASFPDNDWQLTANDSANGGQAKFSIEDITGGRTVFTIEAGARSHSLYVDDGGRIGIRTSTPSTELHMIDGDTPTVRLQQDGSSGFTPQTWDLAGNETSFFIRDVTNGSTLPFRIRPDAPTSSIDIAASGNVGFGTASPDQALDITRSSGAASIVLQQTASGATQYRMHTDLNNNRRIVAANASGTVLTQIAMTDTDIRLFGTDFNDPWLEVSATGIVTTGGGTCDPGPCDGVFDPEIYQVEAIEEHAAFMWENKYLWGVGPTPEGAPINLTQKTTGILHELEKAHIYIEQLNDRLQILEERLANKL